MLSDREIKDLLGKAKAFMEIRVNDLPYLEQALECYNKIIENAPMHPHYFFERSDVKYRLSTRLVRNDLLESAIEDINKAIHLDPDRGVYYSRRGVYLWMKFEKENNTENHQLLKEITSDYKSCLSREPTETDTWLNLIAINIISCNWDETISLYGQCKPYIKDKVNQLYRSYLGCLAFIFAGDSIEEEDIKPLRDQTIRLDTLIGREWYIISFLVKIHGEEDYKEKWSKAVEIEKILIKHYNDPSYRGLMFDALGFYEEAITTYDEAIELDPDYILAWRNKGFTLEKLHRYEEALMAYEKTIELKPDYVSAWNAKGGLLDKLGRHEEAIIAYDKALVINSANDLQSNKCV